MLKNKKDNEILKFNAYNCLIRNIPILEEWSGLEYDQVLYDSERDSKLPEIFRNKIMNHSHLYFIVVPDKQDEPVVYPAGHCVESVYSYPEHDAGSSHMYFVVVPDKQDEPVVQPSGHCDESVYSYPKHGCGLSHLYFIVVPDRQEEPVVQPSGQDEKLI